MKTDLPQSFRRLEYQPPNYTFRHVELDIALDPARTIVKSRIEVLPGASHVDQIPLVLQGQELEFVSLRIDGEAHKHFELTSETLTIHSLPRGGKEAFIVEIICVCCPEKNTTLMGLYVSNGNFFTQCEAEGFRKITYFLDRPDVMARYRVVLRARETECPVLLANGNLIAQEKLPNGWHSATWEDPFPKPSYLFALVAGKLQCIEETITTSSGAKKLLQIWVEPHDLKKTRHAMDSLIASIHWDEKRFGLELDLERFMIVAVSDFNMGAMENKGLNIFNTKFVLAQPETATDVDFANIESVVAHEYFHNWTGNRVTCRDWFQLSLKEGLTVFRDQEFSADQMGSDSGRAVKRIEDVRLLRQIQFPEDAGPMAHPIRPDEYQEINNFYTVTVYEKGAEVVRMYQTLLGKEGFRKGMDLYFKRHDGQAVTCDDFLAAMADANQRDLSQFKNWYSQAGTPHVKVEERYDAEKKQYHLNLSQSCTATPGQSEKKPFHIPLKMRLITDQGDQAEILLELTQVNQSWTFDCINQRPVLSINRNFSAPIQLDFDQSQDDLLTLFSHDDDPFNRWEAGQKLAMQMILENRLPDQKLIEAYRELLLDPNLDPAFKELALTLPAESYLYEQGHDVDPQKIYQARCAFRHAMASELRMEFAAIYQQMQTPGPFKSDGVTAGKRGLKNFALNMLLEADVSVWVPMAVNQYQTADNMSDRYAALACLVNHDAKPAKSCLADFYERFKSDPLVTDKWFALQAMRPPLELAGSTLNEVRYLRQHEAFKLNNPNRVRSLIHAFCMNNPASFHQADGSAYNFWAESVLALDPVNPQVAARLARALDRWRLFAEPYRSKMHAALERVAQCNTLSSDVREVIVKALAN
ncbi:aminopeptidase N [Polynucleobacter paneuropaeus]|uniref:Aminopeptidase N n=1 Tax=Polynucleobacter paneuropaeus TaxID=2527775 RepID=A0A9Q2WHC6_9BURK|nr:aminopeptidase N [Polynucleobacter paneuropaeus]MBT8637377.1 aminopeptidase N [Polynucleobacter paneuropaeus]MBT8638626.1 aminopeptidase N [Polynucleobacter paneuropaeus]QWD37722.1 aminopeptidase N [Polynucleobacter paneuropaeus]